MAHVTLNSRHRATLLTVLLAIAGGALFRWVGSPLPWMIGPLLTCAVINTATGRLHCPTMVRQAGQWVIGLVLGLYFSADVIGHLARSSGWILAGVLWAVVLGFGLAWLMKRLSGMDWSTAFFAAAVGGASEMMVQAERVGGHAASVAAAHSVRIMIVVVTLPFIYRALGLHGTDPYLPAVAEVRWWGLVMMMALTFVGGLVAYRFDWPNAWVIGPLLVSAGVTAAGFHGSAVPAWLSIAGQIAIGMTLGSRFTPAFYQKALRIVLASAVVTLVGIVASSGFGWLLGHLSGIPVATMVLATSPGGIAEMSLTARNLELGVPIVTAFHATRMASLVVMIGTIYRLTSAWFAQKPVRSSEGE